MNELSQIERDILDLLRDGEASALWMRHKLGSSSLSEVDLTAHLAKLAADGWVQRTGCATWQIRRRQRVSQ
jgi:hypothetical protein